MEDVSENGSGSSNIGLSNMMIMTAAEKQNLRKQSRWDAVQEAFVWFYVSLLANYRKCLVFPSKDGGSMGGGGGSSRSNIVGDGSNGNANGGMIGSYGGAGFRSVQFIQSQRSDAQEFLCELIDTQMFDEFITKRLYGSGAADVIFFGHAVDKYLKVNRSLVAGMKMLGLGGKVMGSGGSNTTSKDEPLLQSARVHRKLKTLVPPEPSGASLPRRTAITIGSGSIASGTIGSN